MLGVASSLRASSEDCGSSEATESMWPLAMASIWRAVAGSSRTMLAASASVIAATGSAGVSLSAARELEVSGAELGELMLTMSLLSFDQRRLNGFVIVIPGSSRGKRRGAQGRHLYFPGVHLVARRG